MATKAGGGGGGSSAYNSDVCTLELSLIHI